MRKHILYTAICLGMAAGLPACKGDTAADARDSLSEHMKEHFEQANQIRQAIIAGDLKATTKPARWLADHEKHSDIPETWNPHVEKMFAAARKIADAKDLDSAGLGMGELGVACASCHEGIDARPSFPEEPTPSGAEDTRAHMQRHAWGIERLWEGLIKPSDELWTNGALIFSEEPLAEHEFLAGKTISPRAKELSEVVHELGGEAVATVTPEARGALYGKLLGTCSGCHGELRPPQ